MRAALLPTPGDPFLLTFWLDMFKERWESEVDALYILVNYPHEPKVVDYLAHLCEDMPKVRFIYRDHQMEHGMGIAFLLEESKSCSYIMLIEDDGFIFKGGLVDQSFKLLESRELDLIGGKRGCASDWIIQQENTRWGLSDRGYGDQGPNFWPNFLFAKRSNLERTDLHFGAKGWKAGEIVQPFDLPAPTECASDTFVWASMQLREQGLNIGYMPQYHGSPEDLDDHQRGRNLFDGVCGWVHAGSLSSGYGHLLSDKKLPDIVNTDAERRELERRVMFWQMFIDHYFIVEHGMELDELAGKYQGWINRLISHYELRPKEILKRKKIYQELMAWT